MPTEMQVYPSPGGSRRRLLLGCCVLALTACGGGGGGPSNSIPVEPPPLKGYAFATPQLNSRRVYAETIVDNLNNTISITKSDTVTAVNGDSTYVVHQEDPGHQTVVVAGFDYSVATETLNLDSTGHETGYTFVNPSGTTVTCTLSPHGPGSPYPVAAGDTWTINYTLACSTGISISYSQSGTAVDVESVTVPAGTYSAIKLQSTITWTDGNGTVRTQSITNWRDVATSISVKEIINTSYSGTAPRTAGYPVTNTTVLQSTS